MLLDGSDPTVPLPEPTRLDRLLLALWHERTVTIVLDHDGRIAYVTAAAAALLGRTAAELKGVALAALAPATDAARLRDTLARVRRDPAELRVTFQVAWPDGTARWLDAGLQVCQLDDCGGRVVVIAADVTALQRGLAALGDSEARFRQIAETIDEVFWLTDAAKEHVIYISPAYERVWGRTCASLYASPRSWLEAIHEADRERVRDEAERFLVSGTYDVEYRVVRPDGCVRWVRDRSYPLVEEDGRVLRIAGVASDVTDHRTLQQRIEDSQVLAVIGRLAATVAHDLKNILGVLTLHCGLLAAEPGLSADGRASVDDVVEAAARADALIRQLGVFSSRHAAPRASRLDPLDPSDAATRLVRLFARVLGPGVEVRCHVVPVPRVEVAPAAFDQVLVNLLVNAGDAMPDGGSIDVRIAAVDREQLAAPASAAAAQWVVLAVTDQGHGIAPELLPSIFLPYFTTKQPDSIRCTNRVLAAAIAEAHRDGRWRTRRADGRSAWIDGGPAARRPRRSARVRVSRRVRCAGGRRSSRATRRPPSRARAPSGWSSSSACRWSPKRRVRRARPSWSSCWRCGRGSRSRPASTPTR